jgi:hypothetical protein
MLFNWRRRRRRRLLVLFLWRRLLVLTAITVAAFVGLFL